MKKISFLFLLFASFTFTQKASAQLNPIKQFSEDPVKFLEEVKIMFEATNMDKKEIRDYMEAFTLTWNSPDYTQTLKKATYDCCNLMVKRKIRILPEFKSYLNSVQNFATSKQKRRSFSQLAGMCEQDP
jgi:hypothetical protein